jgi:hypothetical protein
MSQEEFTPRSNANLRWIELTLISSLNQLDIQLQRLSETQEQLILTTDYLQQTSAPLIVLSSIGLTVATWKDNAQKYQQQQTLNEK